MDNRYFLIIIIIAICSVNLFIISSNSDVIGSASVIDGDYVFELPKNFNLIESHSDSVTLQNPNNKLKVDVYTDQNRKYDYNKTVNDLYNSSNIDVLSNGTINVNDVLVNAVYFTKHSDNSSVNRSTFIFFKEGFTFQIDMSNFNYNSDLDYTVEIVGDIVNSIKLNHKK